MKTTILRTVWVTVILTTCAVFVHAADKVTVGAKEKTWTGTVTEVDAKEKIIKAKGFLFRRTFNVPDNCVFSVGDKKDAALGDLCPGHKVHFLYKDVNGVLIANRVSQEELLFPGTVKDIDPKNRILTLKGAGSMKTFKIADDCKVVVRNDKEGSLDDIKTGHKVTVSYETPHEALIAHRIQQKSSTFVGDLTAIDVPARSVKATHLIGNKKFQLADGCIIVLDGKENAQLTDLRIGQKITFSYEDVDGVNVVNRMASAQEPHAGETAKSTE